MKKPVLRLILFCIISFSVFLHYACASAAASAQEYFSIGMAYFDLGKYDEAEKWLNRAKQSDRTMTASQYNLGRIAFETKKYGEAAKQFEDILKIDGDNVLALRAAAYTRIKTGDIEIAEKHYKKLLTLVPESVDDGYNHALVLYAIERYDEAEQVLEKYPFALQDNTGDMLLLYARTQKALEKVEAIDNYSKYLEANPKNLKARYEYAQVLDSHELYARALEEYRTVITEAVSTADKELDMAQVRFSLARLLLIADGDNKEGITEMEAAVKAGFSDIEAVEELQKKSGISSANRDSLRNIVNDMQRSHEAALAKAQAEAEAEADSDAAETEQDNEQESETDS
jgi:tetratricopeptide (TPR) repeat protein